MVVAGLGLSLILAGGFPETFNAWMVAVTETALLGDGIILKWGWGFDRNSNLVIREIQLRFTRLNFTVPEDTNTVSD